MKEESLLQTVHVHKETVQPKLVHSFELSSELFKNQKAQAFLYENYILIKIKIKGKELNFKITFSFDLIFELMRTETEQSNLLGRPFGLKFQRFKETVLLQSHHDIEGILHWRDILAGQLNQRGFHECFKPIKKIGKGNFASVYLVTKHENQKKYAVKAFSKEAAYSEEYGKESLIKEIEIMRQFDHKNLMKLYEVYESQNSIYVSVQLLQGGQLYDKIKAKYRFTQKEIKLVMKGILDLK